MPVTRNILAQTVESRKTYETLMASVLKDMPEKRTLIEPAIAAFQKGFAACEPGIQYAVFNTIPPKTT